MNKKVVIILIGLVIFILLGIWGFSILFGNKGGGENNNDAVEDTNFIGDFDTGLYPELEAKIVKEITTRIWE